MKYTLIIISALLFAVIVYQVLNYPDIRYSNVSSSVNEEHGNDQGIVNNNYKSLSNYSEVIERPLFSIDRKPPDIIKKDVLQLVDISDLEDVVIHGVVISNELKYAIVKSPKDDSIQQIKEGYEYKGWKVISISSESVNFVSDKGEYELFILPSQENGINSKKSLSNNRKRTNKATSARRSPIVIPAANKKTVAKSSISEDESYEELYDEDLYELSPDFDYDENEGDFYEELF